MVDRNDACYFVALVASIILHEVAHGVVALRHGDDTAKRAGRLTLNPVPHIDPFGSVILPALAVFAGFPALGWAKPVPVNPARMRHPRRDMVRVALAGPGTNFALMALCAVAARTLLRQEHVQVYSRATLGQVLDQGQLIAVFLFWMAFVNLFLGIFNLLPIPPLDGSSLVERLVPVRHLGWYRKFAPYGMLVIMVMVFFVPGVFGNLVNPGARRLLNFMVS